MMREIELANLSTKDIKCDSTNRLVSVYSVNSKMDQRSHGVTRTLQCICKEGCDLRCPYVVLEVLANHSCLKGSPEGMLATRQGGGSRATKKDIVTAWKGL